MRPYDHDRAWSDRYLDCIRNVIAPRLIVPAPVLLDQQQNTDLMVLHARNVTIAARVRRPGFADAYPFDVTIRCKRDSGAATELQKLVAGWGDWMFYGHAAEGLAPIIDRWLLIDLHAFRHELLREGLRVAMGMAFLYRGAFQRKSNGDSTHFVAFDVRRFPPSILVASSHPVHGERAA